MQPWQLQLMGVGTSPQPNRAKASALHPGALQSPSGTCTPLGAPSSAGRLTPQVLPLVVPAAAEDDVPWSLTSPGGHHASRVLPAAADREGMQSPPIDIASRLSAATSPRLSAANGGHHRSLVSGVASPMTYHRAADSVRLRVSSAPLSPDAARVAAVGSAVAVSPAAGATSPSWQQQTHHGTHVTSHRGSNPAVQQHQPDIIFSPFRRHSTTVRRQRAEHIPDAFIRAEEAATWARQEGAARDETEARAREAAALEVRTVQNRNADFLHSLEEAAHREDSFLLKGQLTKRRAAEHRLLTTGKSELLDARRFGVANAVLATHRSAEVEALLVEGYERALAADQDRLMQSPKGQAKSVAEAGTTRADATPPPLFSFTLSEEDKHVLMCTLKFAVSHDMISNDADYRSRVGWFRGDVEKQVEKLAATFGEWWCICYTRGIVWNMIHNCMTEARKPVAWSHRPTSRAAYFGRVSVAQVHSLHQRLLRDFALQLEDWKRAGVRDAQAFLAQRHHQHQRGHDDSYEGDGGASPRRYNADGAAAAL